MNIFEELKLIKEQQEKEKKKNAFKKFFLDEWRKQKERLKLFLWVFSTAILMGMVLLFLHCDFTSSFTVAGVCLLIYLCFEVLYYSSVGIAYLLGHLIDIIEKLMPSIIRFAKSVWNWLLLIYGILAVLILACICLLIFNSLLKDCSPTDPEYIHYDYDPSLYRKY